VEISQSSMLVRFGVFELDLRARELRKNGLKIRLQEQSIQILAMLLDRPGELVTREEIQKRLWPNDTIVEFDHSINSAIKRLRQALGDDAEAPRYIETLARRGYRWVVSVEQEEDRPSGRRSVAIQIGAVLALILVAAAVWWLVERQPGSQPGLKQLQLTGNASEDPVMGGAVSPDGKYLAYVDLSGVHLKFAETGEVQPITQPAPLNGDNRVDWRIAGWFPDGHGFLANAGQTAKRSLPPWSSYPKFESYSVWTVSVMGGTPRKLRDEAFAWSVSPDGTSIAFTTNPGTMGDRELWLMDSDGSHARKLFETGEDSDLRKVEWAPNSNRLIYILRRLAGNSLDVVIESRDLEGGRPTTLLSKPGLHDFVWSPDGRLIYAAGQQSLNGATCNLWATRIDARTGRRREEPRQLTAWAGFCMDNLSTTLDNKRLALRKWSAQTSTYVADLEADETRIKNPRRLPLNEGIYVPTAWMADGRSVVFESHRNGHWSIFKEPLEGSTPQLLLGGREAEDDYKCPRISSDGAWLIIHQRVPEEPPTGSKFAGAWCRVLSVPVAGGAPQPLLTASLIDCVRCARSPEGFCAIGEQSSDRRQLIFTLLDPAKGRGRELGRLNVDDPGDDYGFDISPDASHIAVLDFRTESISILSLPSQTTRQFTLRHWINGLDWAADGKGLFVSRSTMRGSELVNVDLQGKARVVWDQAGDLLGGYGLPSPDGRHILMYRTTTDSNMWLLENF
jgi:DNA-binding winged helix-turn-helix (wHTH) protein/Tol biopolymer transport system component